MKTLIVFLFLSFGVSSQTKYMSDSVYSNIKNGVVLTTASLLPYMVAYQTSVSPMPQNQKNVYVTVWIGFAISLDINAIYYFRKAYKLKKIENYNSF